MALEDHDLYDIVFSKEEDLEEEYDSLPPATSDVDVEVSAEEARGGMVLDYSEHKIYIDPSVTHMGSDNFERIADLGIKHLNWHPNHGRGFRPDKLNRRSFYSTDQVSEYQPVVMGEEVEADTEQAVRDIYRNAVDQFKDIFDTEFSEPRILIEDDIQEYSEWFDEERQVGYEINQENDTIRLNEEIVGDLHPDLLNEDFRHMMKRYHDLSAEDAVRNRFVPYVENLRADSDLQVKDVVFKQLSNSTLGVYNPEQQRMKLDISLLPEFNPKTGRFESSKGESTLLHEEIHDLDFTVNQNSRNYLSAVSGTDTDDPRNAVLEAPTTFEVFMAGWENRPEAIEAFKEPLENLEFFRDYPAEDMTSSTSDSIAYPYNMGLITALSIHEIMMERRGVEDGTRTTRDILYGNAWDLKHMGRALETAFEERDVPNVPKHRREAQEIAELGEESIIQEADRMVNELDNWGMDEVVRGSELLHEYEERHSFAEAPELIKDLDRIVYQLKRESEKL